MPKNLLEDSLNHFTTAMMSQLLENRKLSGNIIFSPLSGHLALSMLLNGAEGETKCQLKKLLGLDLEDGIEKIDSEYHDVLKELTGSELFKLESANRLFLGKKSSDEFNEAILNTFGEKPLIVDFKKELENARSVINEFVETKTNGKIQNLISKGILKPSTAFVIVNALYFKGETFWTSIRKHS